MKNKIKDYSISMIEKMEKVTIGIVNIMNKALVSLDRKLNRV
jgi:hypothetical protein